MILNLKGNNKFRFFPKLTIVRIIVRSVQLIFDQINYMKHFGWEYTVSVCFQEIYNDQARDLMTLTPDSKADVSYGNKKSCLEKISHNY